MAEIIRPNFGRKRPEAEKPKDSSSGEQKETNPESTGKSDIDSLTEHVKRMQQFIKSLQNSSRFYKEETVRLREEGLEGNSVDDLMAMLRKSDELQWRMNPSFYLAVARQLRRKIRELRDSKKNDQE